jgi:hypothetical protein
MARFENVLYFVDSESSAADPMRLAVARARSLGARSTFASVIAPIELSSDTEARIAAPDAAGVLVFEKSEPVAGD